MLELPFLILAHKIIEIEKIPDLPNFENDISIAFSNECLT